MKRSKSKISAKSIVTILALICVICIIGVAALTCGKKTVSSDEAFEIVLNDLGLSASEAGSPHIHEGTYGSRSCYNIYVTVDGESLVYAISTSGEILYKGEGEHSH